MAKSPIERLIELNPDTEVWWDSSPLVFESWVRSMVSQAPPVKREELEQQLLRLFNVDHPEDSVFRGCTTNPPLSLTAVKSNPAFWDEWVDRQIEAYPELDVRALAWATYKEVVRRGAEMFMPMFEASGGRHGWLSGQLDARLADDVDQMVADAQELSALMPNVMVKVPATTEGIATLRRITALGISTNVTTCFTLPQILAAANAVVAGLESATGQGVDLGHWRSVITMMIGRLTERDALVEQAQARGISLNWQERHWFGIAVFRRAYRILSELGYPSKLLACSLRDGPLVAGKQRYWDVQKIAGGDIVYTLPPYVLDPLFKMSDNLQFTSEIEKQVPASVRAKMEQIPYCIQAYDPNGMALEQFNSHPATLYTVSSFSKASEGLEEYVAGRLAARQPQRPSRLQPA